MRDTIRKLVDEHAGLPANLTIEDDTDLYRAGMKSFASVQLMLALEEAFEIEFPEELLTRATFRSIAAMDAAVARLSASLAA